MPARGTKYPKIQQQRQKMVRASLGATNTALLNNMSLQQSPVRATSPKDLRAGIYSYPISQETSSIQLIGTNEFPFQNKGLQWK
jgi:hypothetical protein